MDPTPNHLDQAEQLLDELEALEARLNHFQEALARSHRLATLGTMASILAHEFNNILTPMISYCQLALQHEGDVALMRKALTKCQAGSERAAQVCSSILGFARDAQEEPTCQVRRVVDDVFNCLARDPKKDGITLILDIPDELRVAMSPVGLQQVLLNLVLNACQAMRRKGGILRVEASAAGDQVQIVVADTGPGIPEDLLPRIFDPFVSRRDPDIGSGKGTGLGLTVCRDLIRKSKGEITIESEAGKGTTFRILLPVTPEGSS